MVPGGSFLSASFEKLFHTLASVELCQSMRKTKENQALLNTFKEVLQEIYAVVEDAEEKMMDEMYAVLGDAQGMQITIWLRGVNDLVYDMEEVFDEFLTNELQTLWERKTAASRIKTLPSRKFDAPFQIRQLKKIKARLLDKTEEIIVLNLKKRVGTNYQFARREASQSKGCLFDEIKIFGREKDKEAIVQLLLGGVDQDQEHYSLFPIIGMGGLGKTSLAQMVYSDDRVKSSFDLRIWASVSSDFDILSLTRSILQFLIPARFDGMDLNWLQTKLKEILSNRKFLIILDDVWNDNCDDWNCFYHPFRTGVSGCKFIVTTRNTKVATSMGGQYVFHLPLLSEDACLSLFAHHALGTASFDARPDLHDIGTKIVDMCAGLPLQVKTMGCLLHTKLNVDLWRDILLSKIWGLSESRILPALRLSYEHLPSNLKQCFLYFSIFPEGYLFDKDELVSLWMAEGLLPQDEGRNKEQMEDIGSDYFLDLLSRSFLQPTLCGTQFVMHNLFRDLAQSIAENVFLHFKDNRSSSLKDLTGGRTRHISFMIDSSTFSVLEIFIKLLGTSLRTVLVLPSPVTQRLKLRKHKVSSEEILSFVYQHQHIRVLSLDYLKISEFPYFICYLKHLRYLNLSGTEIKYLPVFVSGLINLQTLLLAGCHHFMNLPQNISKFVNLRHLDIADTPKLQEMPAGIGHLENLRKLSKFIVGKGKGLGIKQLGTLSHLRGDLFISGLHNVLDDEDAKIANLKDKDGLVDLSMEWSSRFDGSRNYVVEMQVLNSLQPHVNLRKLMVKYYGGPVFAPWIGHPSFANVVSVNFYDCRIVRSLPSLGRLPLLKDLSIRGLHEVKIVGSEFHGDGDGCHFPCLEILRFEDMTGWEQWLSPDRARMGKVERGFPRLRVLEMVNCPKLTGKLPEGIMKSSNNDLSPLERLEISGCSSLTAFPASEISTPALKELIIQECLQLECITKKMPHFGGSIKIIDFNGFSKLKSLPEFLHSFKPLVQLSIVNCPSLESFPDFPPNGLSFPQLKELTINYCNNLKSLPNHMQNLNSLRSLQVTSCQGLVSLPEGGLPPNLTSLSISSCTNIHQPMSTWGLDRLTFLLQLTIAAVGPPDMVSFPDDYCILPSSITYLSIAQLQNLESLGDGLLNLTSLEELLITDCPLLEHFPRDGLPPTLNTVSIRGCPLLQQHCIRGEGQYWDFLAYIPCVETDQDYS